MSKYIFRNEKGGYESAYDKNSLMKLCYEEITDLEAKLAEKDEVFHYAKLEWEDCLHKTCEEHSVFIKKLSQQLAESEEQVKHWHDLYNERDKQFQSVRQRYHLLNKLQSNYDKKDKLHLAYMQCLELVEENEKLKQQLAESEEKINMLEEHKFCADNIIQEYADKCKNYEKQLPYKEKMIKYSIDVLEMEEKDSYKLRYELAGATETIDVLRKQLAEKEKENSELVFIIEEIEQFAWEQLNNENFDKYKAYDETLTKIKELTRDSGYEKQKQDKTDFVIEKLEKVKEEMTLNGNSYCEIRESTSPYNPNSYSWFNYVKFKEMIDQQIKEVKEKK